MRNIEKKREYNMEYSKQWRELNKERKKISNEEYRKAHAEYFKKYRETHKGTKKYELSMFSRASKLLYTYKKSDEKYDRGEVDLTSQWIVDNIFSKPCAHCGETDWHKIGCNRLDNSKPHTIDNVEPCCMKCNRSLKRKKVVIKPPSSSF